VSGRPAPAMPRADHEPDEDHVSPVATVLGIGNLIAGDDGFGIHALHALQARLGREPATALAVAGGPELLPTAAAEPALAGSPELACSPGVGPAGRVEFVDGGVLGLDLLTVIEAAERLLVLDVVDAGREPGAVIELGIDDVAAPRSGRLSVHQVAFNDLVALARLRGRLPREFALLGVQPADTATSDQLTPHVRAALPVVVERALCVLRDWRAIP
jgi:hydrogenase maturation protease